MSEARLARRTVVVLKAVAAQPEGIGLSELSRAALVSKATCLRILAVLRDEGWVVLDRETMRYRIGLGVLAISVGFLNEGAATAEIVDAVARLAAQSKETAGFDQVSASGVTVLLQEVGPQLIGQAVRPVPRLQTLLATSTGKAWLATLDEPTVRELVGEGAPEGTDALIAELALIRERGYAVTLDGIEPGAASVAAMTGDGDGHAVWIGGPTFRFTAERCAELGAMVVARAAELTPALRVAVGRARTTGAGPGHAG
ncbi:MAG TPA: IclR family transcriptional regulator C-terminal domain-containing protein [Cellulomonas sp.]